MVKVNSFAFSNKSKISHSGVCLQIQTRKTRCSYKLFRQFDDYDKEFLTEFTPNLPPNKYVSFDIPTKTRNIYLMTEEVKALTGSISNEAQDNQAVRDEILKYWNANIHNKKFIRPSYQGYILCDNQKRLWIYDIIPAVKEFSQVDEKSPLPLPDTYVTYSIVDAKTDEEVFSKRLLIPSLLEGDLSIADIFQKDIYLYHIALFYKGRFQWGVFSARHSNRKGQITISSELGARSYLCQIKPDINNMPHINPETSLFPHQDIPPSLSSLELMESTLRITRIKTDTGKPDNFNAISFQIKNFQTSNFPRTFALIYPYK